MNQAPLVAIVGRPNVGKSTLFNRLTGKRRALVLAEPGVTRDRQYGKVEWDGAAFRLIDTAGVELQAANSLQEKMTAQSLSGLHEADLVLVVMDARSGVTHMDREWLSRVREVNKPTLLLINKVDAERQEDLLPEFFELGFDMFPVSAETSRGIAPVLDKVVSLLKEIKGGDESLKPVEALNPDFKIAIIGRPNVGKSTLLNRFLGEERAIADPTPGTTRDPINTQIEYNGEKMSLVDTAGIRKKGRTDEGVEKFSVIKSLKMIDQCHCALILLDGIEGVTEQDAHVAGYAHEKEKILIYLVNKWDEGGKHKNEKAFYEEVQRKLHFAPYSPVLFISARTGRGVDRILPAIMRLKEQYECRVPTGVLNREFERIIASHPLPVYGGKNIKIYYATQAGIRPPTFVVFSNEPSKIHFSYERYLQNALREAFDLTEIPLRIKFKKRK